MNINYSMVAQSYKNIRAAVFQVVDDEGKPKYTVRGDLHIVVTHKTDVVVRS